MHGLEVPQLLVEDSSRLPLDPHFALGLELNTLSACGQSVEGEINPQARGDLPAGAMLIVVDIAGLVLHSRFEYAFTDCLFFVAFR